MDQDAPSHEGQEPGVGGSSMDGPIKGFGGAPRDHLFPWPGPACYGQLLLNDSRRGKQRGTSTLLGLFSISHLV